MHFGLSLHSQNAERETERIASTNTERRASGISSLPEEVQSLVKHLYDQASESVRTQQRRIHLLCIELTLPQVSKTVVAKITTRGIETPLGILSRHQIQRGEDVLTLLYRQLTAEKQVCNLSDE